MFKGYNKETQTYLETFNQNSGQFMFSFADLELVEKVNYRRQCRLLSEELSKKLHQICSEGKSGYIPPIKFIEFELEIYNAANDSLFPWEHSWSRGISNHSWWLRISKANLRNYKISSEGTLKLQVVPYVTCTATFDSISYNFSKEFDLNQQKAKETEQVRTSALQTIENTLKNGNIELEELGGEYFFLRDGCLCDGNLPPAEEKEYHKTHLNKCIWRPDRINEFKDKLIDFIQKKITEFNSHKNSVIQKIIQKANSQGISETELSNNRPNWQNHLRSLKNRKDITNYQTNQLEEDIKNLASAKKKKTAEERQRAEDQAKENAKQEEERLKKEQEDKRKQEEDEKKQKEKQEAAAAKERELAQKRTEFITNITTALNQEPKLTNDELSSQYQNWEEQINGMTELQQIANLQDRLLADIQARRQDKKMAEEIKENLKKAQTGTKEEKEQAWENLEKQETERSYNDNKEEIEKLKKEKATKDPQEYGEKAKKRIEEKLKDNGIKEEELDEENQKNWQKLKNGEIKDPNQLVATETKIKQNIYQVAVKKKVVDLTAQVNKVLKLPTKDQIATVKKLLLEFLSSNNIYYSSQRKTVENLLAQLENCSITNNNNSSASPANPPWKSVIPFLLLGCY